MKFECHRCGSIITDPLKPCPDCEYLLEMSLYSTANKYSLNKHGLFVVSGSLEISAPPLGGTLPDNTSHFDQNIDLESSIKYVFASGSTITPVDSLGHRSPSLYWYFGRTTGSGVFGGIPTYFKGIRLVNPNSPTYIHLFPDKLRPEVDYSINCRMCEKSYRITKAPNNCDNCNHPLW